MKFPHDAPPAKRHEITVRATAYNPEPLSDETSKKGFVDIVNWSGSSL